MSLRGFQCPSHVPSAGTLNDFDHCIHKCEWQCQPDYVLKQIAERESGNEHKGDMISPTALQGCARRLKLTRTEDYWLEPSKMYAATRGSIIHGFVDNCGLPGVRQEKRIFRWILEGPQAPWLYSGRIDHHNTIKRTIRDAKTMTDGGLYILRKEGYKQDHVWQLNSYRWLLNGGRELPDGMTIQDVRDLGPANQPGEAEFWPIDALIVDMFFMGRVISTGQRYVDRVKAKDANYGRPYGMEVKRESLGNDAKGKAITEITFDIPSVPIYDFSKVEQYIIKHGPPLVRAFREPDYIPLGVIGNKDEDWQCPWCEVRGKCFEIEAATGVVTSLGDSSKAA